ncbi:MAG: class I SAM-dependent methyltransferase, partial [Phycisphaera sp.]|nr:class I SAM-dependent methyltransferase [Phycisphaera sp.]
MAEAYSTSIPDVPRRRTFARVTVTIDARMNTSIPGNLEDQIAASLERDTSGIHRTSVETPVSYPDDGSRECAAVEDASFWFRHRNAYLVEIARAHGITGTMLDVGGGNGHVSQALASTGLVPWLVEPSLDGCRTAAARGMDRVACATLADLNLRDESVDAVGLFDVIEHIEHPIPLLEESHRVLRPDGFLLVTVPAFPWLWSNADIHAGHFRRYTRGSLAKSIRQAGFTIERIGYFFSP